MRGVGRAARVCARVTTMDERRDRLRVASEVARCAARQSRVRRAWNPPTATAHTLQGPASAWVRSDSGLHNYEMWARRAFGRAIEPDGTLSPSGVIGAGPVGLAFLVGWGAGAT